MEQLASDTIAPGALVRATDGHLGTVKDIVVVPETGDLAYLVVNRGLLDDPVTVAPDEIDHVATPHDVHLRVSLAEAIERGAHWPGRAGLASGRAEALRIPLYEERLSVGTRQVDLGELRIHTGYDTEVVTLTQPVNNDELVVERVPIGRVLTEPAEPRHDGEWLVIPIMREEVVISTRLVLDEEVRIRKRAVTEERVVQETVRRTRLDFEDTTAGGVLGLDRLGRARDDGAPPAGAPPSA
jgi:uncharacterized protein (TIGR02271 family)